MLLSTRGRGVPVRYRPGNLVFVFCWVPGFWSVCLPAHWTGMEVVPLNLVCEFLTLARFCSSPGFVLPGFLRFFVPGF